MSSQHNTLTLTDYEQLGFGLKANLADGHAYQGLKGRQKDIIKRLPTIWNTSESSTIPHAENNYIKSYSNLIDSKGLIETEGKFVLPTASNSIEIVAAYLKELACRVLLLHPTFDNLALLLQRRGVSPQPISESQIRENDKLTRYLENADALFIVNPNNPTGKNLSEEEFIQIATACRSTNTILIIDASFRLFYPTTWDSYSVLKETKVSYIVFEDTGKVFPTQDMKASILACSADHTALLKELYNEVYLCVSKFSLAVIGEFFIHASHMGLSHTVHDFVAERRKKLRDAIGIEYIDAEAIESRISVEWINISSLNKTEEQVVRELSHAGLGVLPGRGFYWNAKAGDKVSHNIRVSLMKPDAEFCSGIEILSNYLRNGGVI